MNDMEFRAVVVDKIANADLKGNDRIKMKTMGKEAVMINKEMIDLRYVEQIVDSEQVTALGYCMRYAQKHLMNGKKDLRQVIAEMEKVIEKESLDALCESKKKWSPGPGRRLKAEQKADFPCMYGDAKSAGNFCLL